MNDISVLIDEMIEKVDSLSAYIDDAQGLRLIDELIEDDFILLRDYIEGE